MASVWRLRLSEQEINKKCFVDCLYVLVFRGLEALRTVHCWEGTSAHLPGNPTLLPRHDTYPITWLQQAVGSPVLGASGVTTAQLSRTAERRAFRCMWRPIAMAKSLSEPNWLCILLWIYAFNKKCFQMQRSGPSLRHQNNEKMGSNTK